MRNSANPTAGNARQHKRETIVFICIYKKINIYIYMYMSCSCFLLSQGEFSSFSETDGLDKSISDSNLDTPSTATQQSIAHDQYQSGDNTEGQSGQRRGDTTGE